MNYKALYEDVARDFGNDVALNTVIAVVTHSATPVLDKDWAPGGSYSRRVTALIQEVIDPKYIDIVFDIWSVVADWKSQSKSIAELLQERKAA